MTLTELMDNAQRVVLNAARDKEMDAPVMVCQRPGGDLEIILLAIVGLSYGATIAEAARAAIITRKPTAVVLCTEAWYAAPPPDWQGDPDWEAIADGRMTPSELPEGKRREGIYFTGETNEGECLDRCFEIHNHPHYRVGHRTFTERTIDDVTNLYSRFRPLYPAQDSRDNEGVRRPFRDMPRRPIDRMGPRP